jgi:hypothetical protein
MGSGKETYLDWWPEKGGIGGVATKGGCGCANSLTIFGTSLYSVHAKKIWGVTNIGLILEGMRGSPQFNELPGGKFTLVFDRSPGDNGHYRGTTMLSLTMTVIVSSSARNVGLSEVRLQYLAVNLTFGIS